jgi:hypothetical protein
MSRRKSKASTTKFSPQVAFPQVALPQVALPQGQFHEIKSSPTMFQGPMQGGVGSRSSKPPTSGVQVLVPPMTQFPSAQVSMLIWETPSARNQLLRMKGAKTIFPHAEGHRNASELTCFYEVNMNLPQIQNGTSKNNVGLLSAADLMILLYSWSGAFVDDIPALKASAKNKFPKFNELVDSIAFLDACLSSLTVFISDEGHAMSRQKSRAHQSSFDAYFSPMLKSLLHESIHINEVPLTKWKYRSSMGSDGIVSKTLEEERKKYKNLLLRFIAKMRYAKLQLTSSVTQNKQKEISLDLPTGSTSYNMGNLDVFTVAMLEALALGTAATLIFSAEVFFNTADFAEEFMKFKEMNDRNIQLGQLLSYFQLF